MKKIVLFILMVAWVLPVFAKSSDSNKSVSSNSRLPVVKNRVHDESVVWLNMSNMGIWGNPERNGSYWINQCTGTRAKGMEFPGQSGMDYLYGSYLWLGGYLGEADGSFTGPYASSGAEGWQSNGVCEELWPSQLTGSNASTKIIEESDTPDKYNCFYEKVFDRHAESSQQYTAWYSDKETSGVKPDAEMVQPNNHTPLGLEIRQRSYQDYGRKGLKSNGVVLVEFTIYNKNPQQKAIYNLFAGIMADSDVGKSTESGYGADDISGYADSAVVLNEATGEQVKVPLSVAWCSDNDGRPSDISAPGNVLTGATGAFGLKYMSPLSSDQQFSYNWWVNVQNNNDGWGPRWSNIFNGGGSCTGRHQEWVKYDLTPAQQGYHDYSHVHNLLNSSANGVTSFTGGITKGRPKLDVGRYMVMSNSEKDYDQTSTLQDMHGLSSGLWDAWNEIGDSDYDGTASYRTDVANGQDTKFLISVGPYGKKEDILLNTNSGQLNKTVWKLAYGDSIKFVYAYIVADKFHRTVEQNGNNVNPDYFDWLDMFKQVKAAENMYDYIIMHDYVCPEIQPPFENSLTLTPNSTYGPASFTILDQFPADSLKFSTYSSDTTACNNITIGGSGENRTLSFTPENNFLNGCNLRITATNQVQKRNSFTVQYTIKTPEWLHLTGGAKLIQQNGITSLTFSDRLTGFVATDSGLFRTINGAQTWNKVTANSVKGLWDVKFFKTSTGYATGNNGLIIKSTDNGLSWQILNTAVTNELRSLSVVNDTVCFAGGANGTVLKTINGGQSWVPLNLGLKNNVKQILFTDLNNGYAALDTVVNSTFNSTKTIILKTQDGGNTWNPLNSLGIQWSYGNLFFVNTMVGYAEGDSGLFKTGDGGNTWQLLPLKQYGMKYFTSADSGYVVDSFGRVSRTADGGLNWQWSSCGLKEVASLFFFDGNNGIIAANGSDNFGGIAIKGALPLKSKPVVSVFQNPIDPGYLHIALNIDKFSGLTSLLNIDNQTIACDTLASGSFIAHYPLHLTGSHTITLNAGDTTITRTFTAVKTGKSGGSFSCDNGEFSVSYPENTEEYTLAAYLDNKEYFVGHSDFKTSKNLTVRWKTKENKAIYCNNLELATYRDGDYLVTKNGKFGKFSLGEAILNSMTTELYGNYPNPFNPTTNIRFAVGMEDAGKITQLKIYNIKGELVETLLNNQLTAGKHVINWNAARYASGVYYYTLKAGTKIQTAKMLMVK